MKTIEILGTQYEVYLDVPVSEDEDLTDRFGYCSYIEHKIVVADMNTIDSWKNESDECKLKQVHATLRHEVIHAFLNESGLCGNSLGVDAWAQNEEMVDWIAVQFPKILNVYQVLECEGV